MALQFPKGKFLSLVKVGEKGQIVIPKGARELFGIQPGDSLLLMADKKRGIALVAADDLSAPSGLFELAKEAEKENGDSEG
jgi:AbrB family looped-hinge helix DNA binding protein